MKRITYISRFAREISSDEIAKLGQLAERNNKRNGITGFLICSGGVFYQVIEGDEEKIDNLYEKINRDSRHQDITCLRTELNVTERDFPAWSIKLINLNESTGDLMRPIQSLLQVLTESHAILGKYTQSTILNFIKTGLNPLTVPSRKSEKVVFFSDLLAFSSFGSVLSPDQMVQLVNEYLAICADTLAQHQGQVTKFMGDSVMAYFEATEVDNALQASIEILSGLEHLRQKVDPGDPRKYLFAGIGLTLGEVIEGNVGSSTKLDYTIIGDFVNKAAYLESLTRQLSRSLAFSRSVHESASKHWNIISLGTYTLKEGMDPLPIYSIDHPATVKNISPQKVREQILQTLAENL